MGKKQTKVVIRIPESDRDTFNALKNFLKEHHIEYEVCEDYESVMQMSFL